MIVKDFILKFNTQQFLENNTTAATLSVPLQNP